MKNSNRVRGIQKCKLSVLIFICLIGGVACGGSGSSSTPNANLPGQAQDIVASGSETPNPIISPVASVIQEKSVGLRKGICWNSRTQLREVNRKRLRNNANKSCGAVDYQKKLNLMLARN